MKIYQKNTTITNTPSFHLPHPSSIPNVEPPPFWNVCLMICPVLLKYPNEFILNTKIVRNSSTNPDTPPIRLSDVHCTFGMTPPPDTLSGNHPEPVFHPRMNSRSEHCASYCVIASITFHMSCVIIGCCACFVFIISPPLFCCPIVRRLTPMPL